VSPLVREQGVNVRGRVERQQVVDGFTDADEANR
jgi:hypothetical protein